MAHARSLRFSLIAGLFVLQFAVLAGVSWTLYERARRIAVESLQRDAEVRARTLSGIVERDEDGHEFDLDPSAVREYANEGEPVFAFVVDSYGKRVVRSPSLGDLEFAPSVPWVEGAMVHEELTSGPFGIPCAAVTYSFLVRVDQGGTKSRPGREPWVPPTEEERRYQIRVAVDARERDAALASLAWFLVLTSGAALAATLLGGLLLARVVLRPIRRMTADALELDPANPGKRLVPSSIVDELRELAERLNEAFDRLHGTLERQRRFTADAGHELRTPVSILKSNTELLLRRPRDGEEYVVGLERQRRTIERMQALVEDLLTLARADSGGAALRLQPTAVDALFGDIAAELGPVAATRDIELEVAAGVGLLVHCDASAMLRVLRNLVSNALKFTPSGGSVRVTAGSDGTFVRLTVADSGPGIPEADRERVFERFFRVQEGRDRAEGTGLGLAIARTLVVAQGGTIGVGTSDAGGAAFTVRLRRAEGGSAGVVSSIAGLRAPAAAVSE